jgi:hypothetical protein
MSTVTADHPHLDTLDPSLDLGEFMIEGDMTKEHKAGTPSDNVGPHYYWA